MRVLTKAVRRFLICKFRLGRGLLHAEATSVSTAIRDQTSATCDIPDVSFLHWGEATMTAPGESRKQARGTIRPSKTPSYTQNHLNIGCCTMNTIGKTATAMKETRR